MSNVFLNLPVPVAPGIGPSVFVSGIAPKKSLVLEGPGGVLPEGSGADGILILETSQDGVNFAPLFSLNLLHDPRIPPFTVVSAWMRIRRAAGFGGNVILGVSGESTTSNAYGVFAVPANGAGVPIDTSSLGVRKTVNVVGRYTGAIVIEGSSDGGITYDSVLTCDSGNSNVYVFSGVWQFMRVRRAGSDNSIPVVSIGGHPGGGGGAAGVSSCFLSFGGLFHSDGEYPNPNIGYFGNGIWNNSIDVAWDYVMPINGVASGLRVVVAYNDYDGDNVLHLMLNGAITTQTVTIPAGITGAFITSGVSVPYSAGDLMALQDSATYARYSDILFSAMVLYTIS
jgi:hypothetical protein